MRTSAPGRGGPARYREPVTDKRHREPGVSPWPSASELARQVIGPAVGAVAVLLLVALVVSPAAFRVTISDRAPQAAPVTSEPDAPASPRAAPTPREDLAPQAQEPAAPDQGAEVVVALTDLLQQRDAAVRDRDAGSWAQAAGPEDAGAITVLAALPVTRFESSLVPDSLRLAEDPGGTTGPVDGSAAPGTFEARVETTYELASGPAVVRTDTVQLAPDGDDDWRVVGWEPFPAQGEIGTAAPWDLGEVRPTVGERSVVLSWAGTGAEDVAGEQAVADADAWGRQVATWADRGAVTVDSYLGTGWPRATLVLVPATAEQYDALVPGPRSTTNGVFAAVTTDVDTPDGGGGDVVIVNPAAREELVDETWQVTITHELVHVASGARYGDTQEIWLAEGLADLIGWSPMVPATVSRERVASRLLQRVGSGDATLGGLPDNDAFSDPSADVVGDAYESSWLAALLLQDDLGAEGLLQLYADASEGPGSARQRTDGALRSATGEGRAAFEARWREYLTSLAAG